MDLDNFEPKVTSTEGKAIVAFMLRELSGSKYLFRSTIEGCYGTAIEHYNMPPGTESMDTIIDDFLEILESC